MSKKNQPRKICFIITSRAHYGRLKPVMQRVQQHPRLRLQIVAGASAVLRNYGEIVTLMRQDGLKTSTVFYSVIEGENPIAMAKTSGLVLLELTTIFSNLKPDIVFLNADRYEVLPAAIAASYLNIMIAHNQGGEVTGSIDESVRHAVTKLAHLHFTTNRHTARRIIKMGEDPASVCVTGCPSIDLIRRTHLTMTPKLTDLLHTGGVGWRLDVQKPFLVVVHHPTTTEYGQGAAQTKTLLAAVHRLALPAVWLWPNVDAGSDEISKELRLWREHRESRIHFIRNLPPDDYLRLLNQAACCLGNSSSFIREGSFLGVPTVNVGRRQQGRQRARNVADVDYDSDAIAAAVTKKVRHGRYPPHWLYGDGRASARIVSRLARCELKTQKQIWY